MWFNSFGFWLFFIVVMIGYFIMTHRWQNRWLLMASYFFYGCFDWRFLSLILFCTGLNYHAALKIAGTEDESRRRFWIRWSVCISLTVLGVFKYLGFFVRELSTILISMGYTDQPWLLHIMLPAGISFFTFHALSYTIDVYRRDTPVCRSYIDFALFISFFPQLVAGPINRSTQLLPQVAQPRPKCDALRFQRGFYLVITGLFMKVVIADNMAWLANYIFRVPAESLGGSEVLLGIYAFAFQIYGDFAGYSAIACGTAAWMGFDLITNFRRPYFATDPRDFWARWHISLSTWLRDYLYIPMGGNRGTALQTNRNLLATMLLGGLWHGAAWTFVIWGAVHGIWLALHRMIAGPPAKNTPPGSSLKKAIKWIGTFHLICLTWLLFRADSFHHATQLLSALFSQWEWSSFTQTSSALLLFFVAPWLLFEAWLEKKKQDEALLSVAWPWRAACYGFMLLMLLFFPPPAPSEFIYFQF
jgi:D-alanyl-lipoteichoic acid acyltransferase DltB (MBOAT superfamily)